MDERMAILKMLEDGKISAVEASKLLEAISKPASRSGEDTGAGGYDKRGDSGYRKASDKSGRGAASETNAQSDAPRAIVKDMSRKINDLAQDLEPTIQKITEVVTEKTAVLADKISKTIGSKRETDRETDYRPEKDEYHDKKGARSQRKESKPSTTLYKGSPKEKKFEMRISPKEANELTIDVAHGEIFLKGYNGDKITGKIVYTQKFADSSVEFVKLGSSYRLSCSKDDFKEIMVEAYVPMSLFRSITVVTGNSPVTLERITAENVSIFNENGDITLKEVDFNSLTCENINGNISLSEISGNDIMIDNANGYIDGVNIDVAMLKMETSSNFIMLTNYSFKKFNNYDWQIETSNAKLSLSAPVSEHIGYDITANSSLGDVTANISGLVYSQLSRNFISAKTSNFDKAAKKVRFELNTSYAPLLING